MRRRKPKRRRNIEVDEDTAQEIEWALEAAADEMANEYAAEGRSYIGDQDMIDLDDMGFDDQEALKIAEFGDSAAVNQEILLHPEFAKELGLKPRKGERIRMWGHDELTALHRWMDKHDYVSVDRLSGAWPTGEETELQMDHLIDRVAHDSEFDEETVEAAAAQSETFSGDLVYWSSSSGDINMYAQPNLDKIAEIGDESGAWYGDGSDPDDVEDDIDRAFGAGEWDDRYPAIGATKKAKKVYEDAFRRAYKKAAR